MHLTSQWSGRLRAAHFGAAHRRVRRQMRPLLCLPWIVYRIRVRKLEPEGTKSGATQNGNQLEDLMDLTNRLPLSQELGRSYRFGSWNLVAFGIGLFTPWSMIVVPFISMCGLYFCARALYLKETGVTAYAALVLNIFPIVGLASFIFFLGKYA